MSNPYNTPGNTPPAPGPIPTPAPDRQGPRWARKRFVLPALGLALFAGIAIGGQEDKPERVSADPRPTATVTATTTATATATVTVTPEPAPAVTVSATRTVTAEPAVDTDTDTSSVTGSDGGAGSDSGGDDVYYQNCTAARAAGAAPVHVGDPGYGRHLDRDGDGVGCE
ncbi:excalibur calcium-binding domain-containing protein [Streptomyces sp. QTS52]